MPRFPRRHWLALGAVALSIGISALALPASRASLSAAPAAEPPTSPAAAPATDPPSALATLASAQDQEREKAPTYLKPTDRCMNCHDEVAASARVHSPVRDERCELCHLQDTKARHEFRRPKEMVAVCQECHPLPQRNVVHQPVADGKCLDCHFPHHSPQRYLLRKPSETELCTSCHAEQTGQDMEHVHGPVALGLCTVCHLVHTSYEPHLLAKSPKETCLTCHAEMGHELAAPAGVHKPVEEDCSNCHDSHASPHAFQLKTERQGLCVECHQPILERARQSETMHEALLTDERCELCHDTHASVLPKLLRAPIGELCLSCHDEPIPREGQEDLTGIGQVLAASTHAHGPTKDGNCAACHDPHGSEHFSLLQHPYPKGFYAPFDPEAYRLCFECHDSSAFLFESTATHTGFRDGERNLHYLHVNKKDKGRTCRACHETHASNHPFHMTDEVPFGSWMIPLNYERTPTGGSCAPGCHKPKSYVSRPERQGSFLPKDAPRPSKR